MKNRIEKAMLYFCFRRFKNNDENNKLRGGYAKKQYRKNR